MDFNLPSIYSMLLVFLYMVLGMICFLQICRIIYYRHPLNSFQNWFLLLCLFWSTLRTLFFVWSEPWSILLRRIIYVIPSDLQFMTFSLMVLFYAFLIYQSTWSSRKHVYLTIYGLVNGFVIIVTLCTTIFVYIHHQNSDGSSSSDDKFTKIMDTFNHIHMTVLFSVLVGLYAYFGYQLYKPGRTRLLSWSSSSSSLTLLTVTNLIIFISRWLYNVLVTLYPRTFGMNLEYGQDGLIDVELPIFILLVCWEVVPSACVLYMFRHIPPTAVTLRHVLSQRGISSLLCCKNTNKTHNNDYNTDIYGYDPENPFGDHTFMLLDGDIDPHFNTSFAPQQSPLSSSSVTGAAATAGSRTPNTMISDDGSLTSTSSPRKTTPVSSQYNTNNTNSMYNNHSEYLHPHSQTPQQQTSGTMGMAPAPLPTKGSLFPSRHHDNNTHSINGTGGTSQQQHGITPNTLSYHKHMQNGGSATAHSILQHQLSAQLSQYGSDDNTNNYDDDFNSFF